MNEKQHAWAEIEALAQRFAREQEAREDEANERKFAPVCRICGEEVSQ